MYKYLKRIGKKSPLILYPVGLFVILFWTLGCQKKINNEYNNELSHDNLELLSHTLYSDKYELYVEFKPLVVDNESSINTHLTILGDVFSPLFKCRVTANLIIGNNDMKVIADSTTHAGIFKLPFRPTKAGKGKLIFEITTDSSTDKFVIENLNVYPDKQTASKVLKQVHLTNEITFSKEQAWKIPFANIQVRKNKHSSIIKVGGNATSAPGDEAMVSAKSDGIIKFINNKLTIGSPINIGTPMFEISGSGLARGNIDVEYKQDMATFNQAKANYERAKELVKDQIISQRDYLNAKVAFENAQITLDMISKNYREGFGKSNIATINGFIKSILVSEGQYVTAGTPLAIISKNQRLLLQANISQKYFDLLPIITSANFRISGSNDVYNTRDLNGRVVSFGKSTGTGTAFVPLIFEIDNKINIIPGSVVEFFLKTSPIADALVIPVSSLMDEQGHYFVYVQNGGESFEKREVEIGNSDGEKVQIMNGLIEGERVVTKGAYQIKLSTATGVIPAHDH